MDFIPKNNRKTGGFVGINSGKIEQVYSKVMLPKNGAIASFCGKNNGEINKCFSSGSIGKKLVNKFCGENSGLIEASILDAKEESRSLVNLEGLYTCDFANTAISEAKVENDVPWFSSDSPVSLANTEFNNKQIGCKEAYSKEQETYIKISTPEQLINMCKSINEGDSESARGFYILQNDINLKGYKWTPIGNETVPFTGVFDGQGYKIYNFIVKDKTLIFTGFFGYIENADISNLYIDGIIKSGRCTGTFAGINKNGKIKFCGASSHIKEAVCTGGFIGRNAGVIEKCYYKGRIKKFFLIWLLVIIPTSVIALLLYLYLCNPYKNMSVFNNVPIDPYVIKMDEMSYSGEKNKASFSFSDTIEFLSGEGKADIKNPGNSNQGMRVSLQITDEELLNKIGHTGRSSLEQSKLESSETYDLSNSRITISQSGLIPPGYYLPKVTLQKLPNGSVLPHGVYKGIAFLAFYGYDTNEKAIINSQMPIVIVVH